MSVINLNNCIHLIINYKTIAMSKSG